MASSKKVGEAPVEEDRGPQPWAPEGSDRIGRAPTHDGPGERGTAAFDGSGDYNADGTSARPDNPERGPLRGVDYHDGTDLGTHAGDEVGRESASASG